MTLSIMASNKPIRKLLRFLLPLAFWLAVWQGVAMLVDQHVQGRGNELLFPYPISVARSLIRLCRQPAFWKTVLASMGRVLEGMAGGTLAGIVLAVLTVKLVWFDVLLSPAIRMIRATPVASFILLVLLWTGRDNVPSVISGLMVLPVIWENMSNSIRAVDPNLLEMARIYRFSSWKTLRLIYLPSIRPHIAGALTTAMGLAWKSAAAAEVLCTPKNAVGTQIYNSKLYLEIPDLFAWTVVIVMLSLILERLLRWFMMGLGGGKHN